LEKPENGANAPLQVGFILLTCHNFFTFLSFLIFPTGYATSEPKGGESSEKLAKTAEMCLPERKRVRKGGEEDD
jgi:hypothetical protein